ncbi:MAG: hypothetical protein KAJ66_04150 [Candidatus Omnitrophica bacterium]|nr:hypothetical protein [Candidatus Omnitrophota bacterium]
MKKKIAKFFKSIVLKKKRNLIERILVLIVFRYEKLKNILSENNSKTASKMYYQILNLERNIIGGKYSFVSVNELLIWTTEWIKSFPTTYDVVVGIPRSGLLVANMVALKLGKPLTTPELFEQSLYWESKLINKKGDYKNILLIDDSITNGTAMEESFNFLCSSRENLNITKAVLIATEDSKHLVDIYYKIIPNPRIFEWNLVHSKKGKFATDLDGVICENCPPGVDSNEELYVKWIKNAKPYLLPTFEIDVIVSNRLEKYRFGTEKWLAKYGICYKKLILWNIESKQKRYGKYAQRKIELLLKIKPSIFWESSFGEAKKIWKVTKIPTLCIDEMVLFN